MAGSRTGGRFTHRGQQHRIEEFQWIPAAEASSLSGWHGKKPLGDGTGVVIRLAGHDMVMVGTYFID